MRPETPVDSFMNTLRTPVLATVLAASAALTGCATFNVRTDTDANLVNSVHCRSVAWAGGFQGNNALRGSIASPLNETRLREAITANLQNAGITLLDKPDQADCLVGYGIGSRQRVDAVYPDFWVGGGWGGWGGWGRGMYGPWGGGMGWYGGSMVYNQGFLAVDLYDNKTHKPMWHATADQSLAEIRGEEATRRIRAAVDAIFAKFPH